MKKSLLFAFMLCFAGIGNCAEYITWNNGWKQYHEKTVLSHDNINGLYFLSLNDSTDFQMYIDISMQGDTICELMINARDQEGNPKIFYFWEEKATYFFNVFRDGEDKRFSIIKFEYNEENEFTTGLNANGLGQNKLAKQIILQLIEGHQLKFMATPNLAEYQEIKELIIPGLK